MCGGGLRTLLARQEAEGTPLSPRPGSWDGGTGVKHGGYPHGSLQIRGCQPTVPGYPMSLHFPVPQLSEVKGHYQQDNCVKFKCDWCPHPPPPTIMGLQ